MRVDHDFAALDRPMRSPVARDIRIRGDVRRVADLVSDRLSDHQAAGWQDHSLPQRTDSPADCRAGFTADSATESLADRSADALADALADCLASSPAGLPRRSGFAELLGRMDARALTIALDGMLPPERVVAIDSGNFMVVPATLLSVPDASGWCLPAAYHSIGLGLASAIGAALAQPDRLTVAALGDGGFLMSVAELTTVDRLHLPMVILVYNDAAYGAEVRRFGPGGSIGRGSSPLDIVRFPEPHIAAIAEGFGCTGVTVRCLDDLREVREWLDGPRDRALVIDAKIAPADIG